MPRASVQRHISTRDLDLFRALDWGPKTARQLLQLSTTWSEPFIALRTIRQRLQYLAEARLVKIYCYAGIGLSGQEQYYVATRTAFKLLFGPEEEPPTKLYAAKVGLALQPHTRALADFLIHVATTAHRQGLRVTDIHRENFLKLDAAGDTIRPDSALELQLPSGGRLRYFVELDCGTETIRSEAARVSIAKKLRVYDAVRDSGPKFHVLFVCTSIARQQHILESVSAIQRKLDRRLFLAVGLYEFLANSSALTAPIFCDHRFERQALLPEPLLLPSLEKTLPSLVRA